MSAPHEIRVLVAESNGQRAYQDSPRNGVRYLRADLTCGECGSPKRHQATGRLSSLTYSYCEVLCRSVTNMTAACMAFAPKEER